MDFRFTDEQTMLGDSLARTLERGGDAAAVFELGTGAALLPEEAGGFGGTGPDVLMVFRTLGCAAAVTPLLDSVVLGAGILAAAGEGALAEAASTGGARIAVALDEPGQRYDGTVATRADRGHLTGEKAVVHGAEDASHLIVLATDGLHLVEAGAEGLAIRSYALIDGARAAEVTLKETPARRLGDAALLDRPMAAAILALCADALGVMETAVALTTDYLKTRKQFGRAIGSFQAIQHRMADLLTEVEQARSAVWNLAGHLDAPDRDRHVAATKSLVGRVALQVAEETIQLHGGIGMTEEYELAPLVRRLLAADARFGDSDHHLERFIVLGAA
ncbi:acyl-CoA dehydrogenase family protein [Oceaniovalibus guishaninsula JLT2003]|uniref:Acyl-CoA dehydrogenase family protein n=1 Tax=Oceaniovalibus guishaninsula JLT2003 TaxID=1231392 RepID=K2HRY5_9RHOB|nr:acyl-CoA dehydrogenase [Oceaniovalibus guishaninsula]EKE45479.1 acyl-CoA dehydrogenase family protein [Oceaniovalibus guishaninsula JLT2003]